MVTVASSALADWPMVRHDPKRTASASGASDIENPVPYWRYYLGGSIASENLRVANVDAVGSGEVVVVTGGRALAKRATDETVWQTAPLGLRSLVGIADLDGDGTGEVVVRSTDQVHVLSLSSGALLWSEPEGEMGTIGGVRLGDVNGDGLDDIVIAECECCAIRSGVPGVVYSFADSLTTPSLVATLAVAECGGAARSLTLADMLGRGDYQVVVGRMDSIVLLDGRDGQIIATSPDLGNRILRSRCMGVDVDGDGEELLCILNSSQPPAIEQRKAFLLRYVRGATPRLELVWSAILAPDDDGNLAFTTPVVDLDGDGALELLISSQDATGLWVTRVLDLSTGEPLADIPGQVVKGVVPGPARRTLLTASDQQVAGWHFDRAATPRATQAWASAGVDLLTYADPTLLRSSLLAELPVLGDVDGDGWLDVIARTLADPPRLVGLAIADGVETGPGYLVPGERDILAAWPLPGSVGLGIVALLQSDGFVRLLDRHLAPLAPGDDIAGPGLRFGGYVIEGRWRDLQRSLLVASMGGAAESVIAVDSRGHLVRIDAGTASVASPPREIWSRADSYSAAVGVGLAEPVGIACLRSEAQLDGEISYHVEVLRPDGSVVWTRQVPPAPLNDLMLGNFDGDSTADIVFEWGAPSDTSVGTRALSGSDGAQIWASTPVPVGAGRQPAGFALGRFDGDALDDVYVQADATRVISGADGAELASTGSGPAYFQPMLANLDADPADEVILQGGFDPIRALDHDLQATLFASTEDDRPFPYAALARCADGRQVLAQASLAWPARLKLVTVAGTGAPSSVVMVLAGGARYNDEALATAAGKRLGQLSSAAVHDNLSGDGAPRVVLGSSDGWLYAVDPCSGQLTFVHSLGSAVGSPVFGDTDGDGRDEILVSAADGFLYDLRNLTIASPGWIRDVPPDGPDSEDVNSVSTVDRLRAVWRTIPGALSYEVAVVDRDGTYITAPPWQDVGDVGAVTLAGLPLSQGASYFFAVRAIGAQGASVDTVSDGVIVRGTESPDAGVDEPMPGGGGCCETGGTGGAGWVLAMAIALIACRRRGRAHRRSA